jgi:hypothetical protein
VLSNHKGAWEGNFTGTFTDAAGSNWQCFLFGVYKGTGAYAGLTYTAQIHWSVRDGNQLAYDVSGWIEPAK